MLEKKDGFLVNRWKSMGYAIRGFILLIKTENAVIVHVILFLMCVILGWYVGLNRWEWIIQLLCFGLILSIESINTAIEKVCDFVHPDYHDRIGFIKDISAGAVTFAAIFGYLILLIIYLNYFF